MAKRSGQLLGTAAAKYLDLGGVPDKFTIYNAGDGDEVDICYPRYRFIPFTSGGVQEPKPGDILKGATSFTKVTVHEVLLASGTWAGGDAAGFIVADVETMRKENGTPANVGSENLDLVKVTFNNRNALQANVMTVTAGVTKGMNIAAAVAAVDNSNDIAAWMGDDTYNFKGVVLGTDITESGDLLIWEAEFFSEIK